MSEISLSKAIDGYFLYAHSRRLSENTVRDYGNTFRRFQVFLAPDDPVMSEITHDSVEAFFAGVREVSRKTILNYHTGLSALWTWAVKRGIVDEHILRRIDPPRPEKFVVEILTEEEVQRLLFACDRTPAYTRPGKRKCSNKRPTALRDKAIILTLLDSMVRVSELCGMLRSNTKLKEGRIKVIGKGDKERWVPISSETAGVIWQYLAGRPRAKPMFDDFVFLTREGRLLNRKVVGRLLARMGKRIGVHANPHKFRHTGATMFLRNAGNVFALKEILGHSTMTMVNRSTFYYQPTMESLLNLQLMRLIDEQYTKTPFYGYPKMTAYLRRSGHRVNPKRVRRLMLLMDLQAIYPKPRTTVAAKEHKVYPYLLRGLRISRPNQVWCADITYVPMFQGFMYLVAIMDWFSRYVIAWRLSNTLDGTFCLEALRRALQLGPPEIFNTDQGAQFTAQPFIGCLETAGVRVSMDGRGRVMDNIFVERLWRTVKYEDIYLKEYATVPSLEDGLRSYFTFYNNERPHQSLGYCVPAEVHYARC